MAPRLQITLDCRDPHAQARFWAEALGYDLVQDPAFVQAMLDQGLASPDEVVEVDGVLSFAGGAAIEDPGGTRPRWFFQQVDEPKPGKNRMHLDIHLTEGDRSAEVARLIGLGATELYEGSQGHHTWITMADPEGNEFCIAGGDPGDSAGGDPGDSAGGDEF